MRKGLMVLAFAAMVFIGIGCQETQKASTTAKKQQNSPGKTASLAAVDLRCEYMQDPLGIDAKNPRLFWKLSATHRAAMQTAYQLIVASSAEKLTANQGDLWDSGKVASSDSIQIEYAGAELRSGQQCFWKVRVWDEKGTEGPWSRPALWTMGLLKADDWKGKWIGKDEPAGAAAASNPLAGSPGLMYGSTLAVNWCLGVLGRIPLSVSSKAELASRPTKKLTPALAIRSPS